MQRLLLCLFFLASLRAGHACINEKKAHLDGRISEGDAYSVLHLPDTSGSHARALRRLQEYDSLWRLHQDLDAYSDYGVQLVYVGRYPEARAVFYDIERRKPGEYATAANLGTLYELMGVNDSALLWIRRAVAIDPSSHSGSEWIHVNLLRAKLGEVSLTAPGLLGIDMGSARAPVLQDLSGAHARALEQQLTFQLNERMRFVAPPDPIVATLLFELGNLTALNRSTTDALRVYDLAAEYGYRGPLFNERYAHFLSLQQGLGNEYSDARPGGRRFPFGSPRMPPVRRPFLAWAGAAGALVLVVAAVALWRRGRPRKERA